jgi:hypothetical protein
MFDRFWEFLVPYLFYRKFGVKDIHREYDLLTLYWIWIKDISSDKFKNFNDWIIVVNNICYEKQKGFTLR